MARKMKDSGIEWIGEIPEGWELIKAKYLFSQRNEKGNSTLVLLSPTQKYGVIPQSQLEGVVQVKENTDLRAFKTIHIGDFVISLRSFQGGFEFSNYEGVCSPAYQVLHATKDLSNDFFRYLFKSDGFISKINSLTVGIREGKNIQYWDFSNMLLALPPKEIQIRSAQYLNAKCTEIDTMLSKTRSSIEEYKKLKQAVITQAVTKGVRGEREMKDSGVDWISEIPANWTVKRGKQLFSETNERSETGSEELLTVSHITGVTPRSQKNVNMFMSESLVGYKICHNGDLAANTMWMWQGAIGVSKFHGVISPSYNTYRQKTNDYYFEYLDYLLRIRPLIDAYTIHSTGITLSRLRLYPDSFLSLYFIVPPITEQKEIADYLDAKCAEIAGLIAKKEQLVKELENYKKSLIYEVVTGKREV
mgnify:CR=1 FL=1